MIFSVIELVRSQCANCSQLAQRDYKITSKPKKLSDAKCASHAQVAVERLNFPNSNGEDVDKVGSLTGSACFSFVLVSVCIWFTSEFMRWSLIDSLLNIFHRMNFHYTLTQLNATCRCCLWASERTPTLQPSISVEACCLHLVICRIFSTYQFDFIRVNIHWIHLVYFVRGLFW